VLKNSYRHHHNIEWAALRMHADGLTDRKARFSACRLPGSLRSGRRL